MPTSRGPLPGLQRRAGGCHGDSLCGELGAGGKTQGKSSAFPQADFGLQAFNQFRCRFVTQWIETQPPLDTGKVPTVNPWMRNKSRR